MARKKIPETEYRASRLCRVLGNPTAYQITSMLKHTNMTPTDLSHQLGLTLKTICSTLRHMREVNLVRYETENKSKIYYLKDKLLLQVLESIEMYVNTMRAKKW